MSLKPPGRRARPEVSACLTSHSAAARVCCRSCLVPAHPAAPGQSSGVALDLRAVAHKAGQGGTRTR